MIGHLADAERVFCYRLLRIARGDQTPLPGFDENAWAETAPHADRRLADVADELIAVRRATIALVRRSTRRRCRARRGQQQAGQRAGDLLDHRRPLAASRRRSCASDTA